MHGETAKLQLFES